MKKEKTILACDLAYRHGAFYFPQKNFFIFYENMFKKLNKGLNFLKSLSWLIKTKFPPDIVFYEYSHVANINRNTDRLIYASNCILFSFLDLAEIREISMSSVYSYFSVPRKIKDRKYALHLILRNIFPAEFSFWRVITTPKKHDWEIQKHDKCQVEKLRLKEQSDCFDAFAVFEYAKNYFEI